MIEQMKEIEPKADRAMVRTKINALRTSYRRVEKSEVKYKVWSRTDDIYKPNECSSNESPLTRYISSKKSLFDRYWFPHDSGVFF